MPEIIFDTCVLSNFALSGALPLLKSLYSNSAFVSDMVALENLRGIRKGHAPLVAVKEALAVGWLREVSCYAPEEKRLFETLSVSLGIGEASCIAIARHRDYVFACDDRAARKEAALCGVRLTGTVGILIKAVRVEEVDLRTANSILKKMVGHGFYAPVERVTREMVG
ncbi:MAG: DNA-binding [Geobacteraceae bacterium]|nr:MAG: DNA-binding [Geobacteraceae bacterium]